MFLHVFICIQNSLSLDQAGEMLGFNSGYEVLPQFLAPTIPEQVPGLGVFLNWMAKCRIEKQKAKIIGSITHLIILQSPSTLLAY